MILTALFSAGVRACHHMDQMTVWASRHSPGLSTNHVLQMSTLRMQLTTGTTMPTLIPTSWMLTHWKCFCETTLPLRSTQKRTIPAVTFHWNNLPHTQLHLSFKLSQVKLA